MKTEEFSKKLLQSKIFDTYVAAVFFGTVIFFVLNADFYTPIEMIFWVIFVTILFKGLANIMLSLLIALFNLSNEQHRMEFEKASDDLDSLVNDLAIQEAAVQSAKTNNGENK
jgi:phosphotransferase system  glucose/maltose/N-acetylglucosamine-specific IIC component